jgi:hypothetical protein
MCIEGSEAYADYREQLLPWRECEPLVATYCQELDLPPTAEAFVHQLRMGLDETARQVDSRYPANSHLTIDANSKPSLKRTPAPTLRPCARLLEAALQIPRSEILSSRRRSTSARCSSVITKFSGVRTKARPHNLQRWFCFPVWIWPFLLYQVDPHCGHASLLIIVLPIVFPVWRRV